MTRPTVVVVTGPTASGKTALAIELAQWLGTEIVSADSRQIYRDIPIGTAAPDAAQRAAVPHHLVGFLSLDAYYSAACFEADAMRIVADILGRHGSAVVCGGSMMYVDALARGIDEMPTVSDGVRDYVLRMYTEQGLDAVLAQLQICDPDYYAEVDRRNPRRVIHAVEVSLQAGVPYSSLRTGKPKERPFDIVKLAIDLPREELFGRIRRRVDQMIADGLVDEARRAFAQGDFNSLNTVGYKEMRQYLAGGITLVDTAERIARNTRVYAKKQLTWLRRTPDVHYLPASSPTTAAKLLLH